MFFNRTSLINKHTEIYFESDFEKIDFGSINFYKLAKDISVKYDGFNFIKNNIIPIIVERFKNYQPLTYKYLVNGEFFYAIDRNSVPIIGDSTKFGIIINDIAYYIDYDPHSYANKETIGHFYIPKELLCSWFFYSNSWCSVEEYRNIERRNLPSLVLMPMHSIIEGFEGKGGYALPQYTDFLESKFNHAFRQNYLTDEFIDDEKYFELRCLLDTRSNDDWSESGYQLFISSHNQERNVYVVPRADVMGIKKLTNPVEAIDSYAAHLFSRAEGEFDFMQYVEDF